MSTQFTTNKARLGSSTVGGTAVGGKGNEGRLNYFDGRLLSAESLTREQQYWDSRIRTAAMALECGVAWGLWVQVTRSGTHRPPAYALRDVVEVGAGLALDGMGRPIRLTGAISFSFAKLFTQYAKSPRAVALDPETLPGGCLRAQELPVAEGDATTGAFLLAIRAEERPTGRARVYEPACCEPAPEQCEHDVWCNGYGIHLLRVPNLGIDFNASDWVLRGAWAWKWFELGRRRPAATLDPKAWGGPARAPLDAPWVPLALIHYVREGDSGRIAFADPHISRRHIVSTTARDWISGLAGADDQSTAHARFVQFQLQLAESFAADPTPKNLLQRGFRLLPPAGLLPLPSAAADAFASFDAGSAAAFATEAAVLERAREPVHALFEGTDVLPIMTLSRHTDPIASAIESSFAQSGILLGKAPSPAPPLDLLEGIDTFGPMSLESAGTEVRIVSDVATTLVPQGTPAVVIDNPAWTAVSAEISGASWLWRSATVERPEEDEEQEFERIVEVPLATEGIVRLSADDVIDFFVNGQEIVSGLEPNKTVSTYRIRLRTGRNELRWRLRNIALPGATPQENPAGVIYELKFPVSKLAFDRVECCDRWGFPSLDTDVSSVDRASGLVRALLRIGPDNVRRLIEGGLQTVQIVVPMEPVSTATGTGVMHLSPAGQAVFIKRPLVLPAWAYLAASVVSAAGGLRKAAFWEEFERVFSQELRGDPFGQLVGIPQDLLELLRALSTQLGDKGFVSFMNAVVRLVVVPQRTP